MNKNQIIIGAVVIVLLLAGVLFVTRNHSGDNQNAQITQSIDLPSSSPQATDQGQTQGISSDSAMQSGTKEFVVTGSNFKFTPATLTVNQGDTVKITFKNASGIHDFVIDELNVKTKTIQGGGEETVTFSADKAGTFEYYCSVGNHRAMGMKGTLVVQ